MHSRAKIAAFLYHDVADRPSESGFQRRSAWAYKQTRRDYDSHLEAIAQAQLTPGDIADINLAQPEKHLLVTFDDGGKSALYAAEKLSKRGWKGHFFVTTSLIGTATFLDAAEVRHLRSCGHVIGSHSHTHPDIFKDIPFEQMVSEWQTSCAILSEILGEACVTGSVPGGDVSRKVYQSADRAGMKYLFTSDPVLSPRQEGNCWIVGRACPKVDAPAAEIAALAQFRGWKSMLLRRQAKTLLKTSLFPLYRMYVRHALQHQQQ